MHPPRMDPDFLKSYGTPAIKPQAFKAKCSGGSCSSYQTSQAGAPAMTSALDSHSYRRISLT